MKTVLVTGGTGCIGAATVAALCEHGGESLRVVAVSRSADASRIAEWLGPDLDPRLQLARGDLGELASMRALLDEHQPTHIVHLAALQSPDCAAHPARGMDVNVGGTLALLEAVEAGDAPLERFVFASSAAVYGKRRMYDTPRVREDAMLAPPNLYGVWKVAGEGLCRLFAERSGVSTICLRLNTTYGKGRDLGMTAAVTTAMKCVARGEAFRMPYRGRENYHYVEDVGAQFAAAALRDFDGFGAFNLRGETIEVADFLEQIRVQARASGLEADLDFVDEPAENLFVCDLADDAIQAALGELKRTSIEEGVRKTLAHYAPSA